jgi:peptide/nickel transport system permease protein
LGLREYVLKRVAFSIVLIFFVAILNFIIFELMPGNPLDIFIRPGMRAEQRQELLRMWQLDRPVWDRFVTMLYNMFSGNFLNTVSFFSQEPISKELASRVTNTLILVGASTILSMIIGIMLGVVAAYKRGGKLDSGLVLVALATYSFPTFWMGMLAILVFSIQLKWLPSGFPYPPEWASTFKLQGGFPPPLFNWLIPGTAFAIRIPGSYEVYTRLTHLALPLGVLTLFQYGGWLLLARASVLETITEDYVVTARAKGIKERTILFRHVLKNASLPLITSAALSFGFMLSGAIITEGVFSYRGLGAWIWDAVQVKDFPVLQAMFFIIGICVIVANFISDLLYGIIDPRIKYG